MVQSRLFFFFFCLYALDTPETCVRMKKNIYDQKTNNVVHFENDLVYCHLKKKKKR